MAAEIRAEIARRGLSRKVVAQAAGINSRSWSRYFVTTDRAIPLSVISSVAAVLGVSTVDLIERAEAHIPAADPLHEAMSDEAREAISPLRDEKPTVLTD